MFMFLYGTGHNSVLTEIKEGTFLLVLNFWGISFHHPALIG
jgi:hypothetical protein